MALPEVVARLRLTYHLNMIDVCNAAHQLKMLSGERADRANEKHLKQCLDCYERLGVKLPKEFVDFKNEKKETR